MVWKSTVSFPHTNLDAFLGLLVFWLEVSRSFVQNGVEPVAQDIFLSVSSLNSLTWTLQASIPWNYHHLKPYII